MLCMTLEQRMNTVRTLTRIQLALSFVIGIALFSLYFGIMSRAILDSGIEHSSMILAGIGLSIVCIFALILLMPWIVLEALKRRTARWATAAMIALVGQIALGGGLLSIFPMISLALLLQKDARMSLGMK